MLCLCSGAVLACGVVVGLCAAERFLESVCCLEVVYGEQYLFSWAPQLHSHRHSARKTGRNMTAHATQLADKLAGFKQTAVYRAWRDRNTLDVEFYNNALRIFDAFFKDLLVALNRKLLSFGTDWKNRLLRHFPHCQTFAREAPTTPTLLHRQQQ